MKRHREVIPASHYNSRDYMLICEIQQTFLLLVGINIFYFRKYFSVISEVDGPMPFGFENQMWTYLLRRPQEQIEVIYGWKREKWLSPED